MKSKSSRRWSRELANLPQRPAFRYEWGRRQGQRQHTRDQGQGVCPAVHFLLTSFQQFSVTVCVAGRCAVHRQECSGDTAVGPVAPPAPDAGAQICSRAPPRAACSTHSAQARRTRLRRLPACPRCSACWRRAARRRSWAPWAAWRSCCPPRAGPVPSWSWSRSACCFATRPIAQLTQCLTSCLYAQPGKLFT